MEQPAYLRLARLIVDSRRRKASASLEHLDFRFAGELRHQLIPDAERRLPHWSAGAGGDGGVLRGIPDAERRLPHWSFNGELKRAKSVLIPDAERRLPHWSVAQGYRMALDSVNSRRRKASASLERLRARRRLAEQAPIPDAERRLPHWSASAAEQKAATRRIPDAERRLPHWSVKPRISAMRPSSNSRRRKASASLERAGLSRAVSPPRLFQTPKGVCLIGAA